MKYHVNPKTRNANVCRVQSCKLEHFSSKGEAEASKSRLAQAINSVKDEVKKDEVVKRAREEKAVKPSDVLTEEETVDLADQIANETQSPVTVEDRVVLPRKASKKQQVKNLAHDIVDQLDRLAKLAPKHPLVRSSKKAVRKIRK